MLMAARQNRRIARIVQSRIALERNVPSVVDMENVQRDNSFLDDF
jgi:hypothetical protein